MEQLLFNLKYIVLGLYFLFLLRERFKSHVATILSMRRMLAM